MAYRKLLANYDGRQVGKPVDRNSRNKRSTLGLANRGALSCHGEAIQLSGQ